MAKQQGPVLAISDLRGGLNDSEPPMSLSEDACTIAENVEFYNSTIGERRLGCVAITLPTTITSDVNLQAVTWMGRHLPTNTPGDDELWVLSQHLTDVSNLLTRRTKTAWFTVAQVDAIISTTGLGHKLSGVSLHGKFFIAYKSAVDILHVWDGTTFRRVGLAAPSVAPTAVDTGGGAFSGTRYYRVREVVLNGAAVTLRSEPSAVLTKVPSGAGTGLIVTRPATINTSTTHWELEASTDNANFYRIARTAIGTTTVTDSVAFGTGYAISGVLSESLTAYSLVPSGKFMSVDNDRIVMGGSWENPVYSSRLWWTPVFGDTGTGNDERLDMTVNPYIDLDGYEGGELTGLSRAVNGYLYAFKWGHIYKVVRTGNRQSAYNAIPLTKARGALPGSLVEAVDQAGSPAQYFLDPTVGPMRIGANGLEACGRDLQTLWRRVNVTATTPCHGVFYRNKNQVHFWVALDGADYPNAKIVVHCDELTSTPEGARRGWVTVPVGDRIADAHCSLAFSDNVDSTVSRNQNLVPFIGKQQWTVAGVTTKDLIQRCDIGSTDAYTLNDSDAYFWAQIQTKQFTPYGLLNLHGIMAGVVVAEAVDDPDNDIYIRATRDFGAESITVSTDLSPVSTESIVVRRLDNLSFSELTAVQFTFGDLSNDLATTNWRLHSFHVKLRPEQSS